MIRNIDYHVTDRCNLNCVACGHFCSLVPRNTAHKSLEQVENDFKILSNYSDCFQSLTLTGGECTLNPNLIDIMYMARKYFPNNILILYTNGTTFSTFEKYRQAIDDNMFCITATTYPNVGDNVYKLGEYANGRIAYIDNPSYFHKVFFSGNECATDDEILNCGSRGYCIQFADGKIYPCQYAAYFKYFDDAFKGQHKLSVDGTEYIDLTENPDKQSVIDFVYNANFGLCKHCLDAKRNAGHYYNDTKWTNNTDLNINEWYIDNYEEN